MLPGSVFGASYLRGRRALVGENETRDRITRGQPLQGTWKNGRHSNTAKVLGGNKLHVNNTLSVNNIWQTNVHLRGRKWTVIPFPKWGYSSLTEHITYLTTFTLPFISCWISRRRRSEVSLSLLLVLLRTNQDIFQRKSQKPISDAWEDWNQFSETFSGFFSFPHIIVSVLRKDKAFAKCGLVGERPYFIKCIFCICEIMFIVLMFL